MCTIATTVTFALLGIAPSDANDAYATYASQVVPVRAQIVWRLLQAPKGPDLWDQSRWIDAPAPPGIKGERNLELRLRGADFAVQATGQIEPGVESNVAWIDRTCTEVSRSADGQSSTTISDTCHNGLFDLCSVPTVFAGMLPQQRQFLRDLAAAGRLETLEATADAVSFRSLGPPLTIVHAIEGTLDPRRGGMPVRLRLTNINIQEPFYREMRVAESTSIDGLEIPTLAYVLWVPFGDHVTIEEFRLTSIERDDTITSETLAVAPVRQNGDVLDRFAGEAVRYGPDGSVLSRHDLSHANSLAVGHAMQRQILADATRERRGAAMQVMVLGATLATAGAACFAWFRHRR
ncbi:MAG: hypothetical protein CHACPFDD_01797 [Phycisphaerae bacterium]|nr:hypothetical protein [Phycisphaerae bacterium]